MSSAPSAEIGRVGKFGVVGILNTLIDFTIFNVVRIWFGLALIPANIISTTCAMIFSFFANRRVVFKQEKGSILKQAAIFFAVTAVGLYVIQSFIIHSLTVYWTAPMQLAVVIVHTIGL